MQLLTEREAQEHGTDAVGISEIVFMVSSSSDLPKENSFVRIVMPYAVDTGFLSRNIYFLIASKISVAVCGYISVHN